MLYRWNHTVHKLVRLAFPALHIFLLRVSVARSFLLLNSIPSSMVWMYTVCLAIHPQGPSGRFPVWEC